MSTTSVCVLNKWHLFRNVRKQMWSSMWMRQYKLKSLLNTLILKSTWTQQCLFAAGSLCKQNQHRQPQTLVQSAAPASLDHINQPSECSLMMQQPRSSPSVSWRTDKSFGPAEGPSSFVSFSSVIQNLSTRGPALVWRRLENYRTGILHTCHNLTAHRF